MDLETAARVRRTLIALARARGTVTYRELAERAEVPPPHRIHSLTLLLEDMAREDHAAGRPLLAALAVSRARAPLPGRGFFELLAELGRYQGQGHGLEAADAHAAELDAAWSYWGRPSS